MEVIEGLHEILGAPTPSAQLGDEDGGDLAGPGEGHHLVALRAIILSAGGCLLEHRDNLVAGALGEGAQVALLAVAVVSSQVSLWSGATTDPVGPLAFFAPVLWRTRREAVFRYGHFALACARLFERRWLEEGATGDPLGSSDIQSMADLANVYR